MHGHYLIRPGDDGVQEVYLLLKVEGELIGVRIDREFSYKWSATECEPFYTVMNILLGYEQRKWVINHRKPPLPILDGGPDERGLFFVYNDLEPGSGGDPISRMYTVSYVSEMIEADREHKKIGFLQVVHGFKRFDEAELKLRVSLGEWEMRLGLHALFYAPNLAMKEKYIQTLRAPRATSLKAGKLDLGDFLDGAMTLFKEAQPTMMHVAVAGYLRNTAPEMNENQVYEVLRMMVAISEKEGAQVTDIMRKYTSTELVAKYDEVLSGGFRFRLLSEFDERMEMLRNLGFDPFIYDVITKDVIFGSNPPQKPVPKSGRTEELKRTISKVAEIVKSKGDAGGAT